MRFSVEAQRLACAGMIGLTTASPAVALQPERPEWTRAVLTAEDVGPGFERARQELIIGDDFASYLVLFQRPSDAAKDRHFAVGSMLLRVKGDLTAEEFDRWARRIASGQGGFERVDGPRLGEDTRWFAGPWSEDNPAEESRVIVARLDNIVLSVLVGGPTGTAGQNTVLGYATTVIDRLERLAPRRAYVMRNPGVTLTAPSAPAVSGQGNLQREVA